MTIHPYYFSFTKRCFDCLLAIVLLVGLSPLFLLVAVCILLTSGFPVIFRQNRMGWGGHVFRFLKFRTMKKNAQALKSRYWHLNEAPAPMFKIRNDPRFTAIGSFLSKSGLDELPQLWNILRGEMSFVGPRPLPVAEAQKLPATWRGWREQVRPGIFSEWAFSPKRHRSLKDWRELEEKTLKKGSVASDLARVFQSFSVIFSSLVAK